MKKPEPTIEQLHAAFERCYAARGAAWQGWTFERAQADPVRSRLLRAAAMQQAELDDRRAHAQVPLRYRTPDGQWRTRMVLGPKTPQLELIEDKPQ